MKKIMYLIEYTFLFLLGGSIYYGVEIGFRGYSHFSMFIVGGICLILIGLLNEVFPWEMAFWKQVLIGDLIVLAMEFISGCIVNLWLHWNVWNYSNMPLNLMGQVCVPFAFLFMPLVAVAIVLDDWVKYILFGGRKPSYKFK